jgi:hypothetical protein
VPDAIRIADEQGNSFHIATVPVAVRLVHGEIASHQLLYQGRAEQPGCLTDDGGESDDFHRGAVGRMATNAWNGFIGPRLTGWRSATQGMARSALSRCQTRSAFLPRASLARRAEAFATAPVARSRAQ